MQAIKFSLGTITANLDNTVPRLFIGRDNQTCGLATADSSVSRRHAEVFLQNGQAFIRDLGSSNGTWVNGNAVGQQPVALAPGQQVYIGRLPLAVEWSGPKGGATVMAMDMPAELKAMIEQRQQQASCQQSAVPFSPPVAVGSAPVAQSPASSVGVGGSSTSAQLPAAMGYRRQGANNNGALLIALQGDTFSNDSTIDGFVEFTATDNETVNSITVELVECHKKGKRNGHTWDRVMVRQGPWKAKKGDVLPMPFQLRVPPGTSISGRDVHWEIRGYVDISFAFDVEAISPVHMRNYDIERIRDALGALDYRIVEMDPAPLGQRYTGKFQPPAQLVKQLGLRDIGLEIEYLGTNLKFSIKLDKRFRRDKKDEIVFDLPKLRAAPLPELSQYFQGLIGQMMA